MPVVPLVQGKTVVTSEQAFEAKGGRSSGALLIRNFDAAQLMDDSAGSPNLSYDLRVGSKYKDHRDGWKRDIARGENIVLRPGGAVIIETEESLHMPASMFGYIVPRVKWLQRGVSNTLSKVDPGYNGRLLVTLFNLGKNKIKIPREERFCSLVIHDVGEGARLYDKDAKEISGRGHRTIWQRFRDGLEANRTAVEIVLILATLTLAGVELHLYQLLNRFGSLLGNPAQ
jgi:dCTP deaminase